MATSCCQAAPPPAPRGCTCVPGRSGTAFPVPPARCRILPGKVAVKGLRGAKRRDAKAAGHSALMGLSRRQDRPAREDGPAALAGASAGCVTGGPAGGGCGGTALRRRPAPCVPTLRQWAGPPPTSGQTPCTPAIHGQTLARPALPPVIPATMPGARPGLGSPRTKAHLSAAEKVCKSGACPRGRACARRRVAAAP